MTIGQEIDLGWIAVVLLAITALIAQGRDPTKACWLTGVVLDGCALVPECNTRQVEYCCAIVLSLICQRRERIMAVQRIKGQLGLEIVLLGEAVGGSVSSSLKNLEVQEAIKRRQERFGVVEKNEPKPKKVNLNNSIRTL